MHCPFCGARDTRVVDSRLNPEGDKVRRRRECAECGERFTTYESAELAMPEIVKSDGCREVFSEAKLRSGIARALEKRPVSAQDLDSLVAGLVKQARSQGEREISSQMVGEWVMARLRQLDQVAYVRFASVYRSFEDVDAFRREVEQLQQDGPSSKI